MTLKEYLQATQLNRKLKKEIIGSAMPNIHPSNSNEEFSQKLIEIKAKLQLYVLNEKNAETIGKDLDELSQIYARKKA